MKKIYLFAAAAAMFAACTSDEVTVNEKSQPQVEQGAVSFDAYTQRAVTRAGTPADLTINVMKGSSSDVGKGFGVFGYYTDNNDYDQLALPNFMWNQQVKAHFDGSDKFDYWVYEPVKYWPNEYGGNAISDDNDKITFFAYAPYVEVGTDGKVDPGTGDVKNDTWGITGMTRNTNAGDPIIKYIGSFKAANAVDLCWGVCQQDDWQLVQGGGKQKFDFGKPWLNVQRPAGVDQKLKFLFRHALAKMQIDVNAFVDGYTSAGHLDDNTRIWIRSVRFTGFTMKGALNLNNENPNEPYWMNYNGIGDLVADDDVTVYDQRKDGKEGVSGATATNEKVGGLNTAFIQTEGLISSGSTPAWTGTPTGVVEGTAEALFKEGGIFYVIPTGDPVEIEIVYDVETISPNLANTVSDGATPGSSIENRISKKILFGDTANKLEPGKAYNIHLHLGMNSVKFDAEVVDWDAMAAPDIDLPANMPAYAATTTSDNTLAIPGADTEFVFAITGLKGGEAIPTIATTVPGAKDDVDANVYVHSSGAFESTAAACDKRANASGVVYVKVDNVTPNTTIQDLSATKVSLTGALSTITTVDVIQKAEALGLVNPGTGTLTLKRKVLSSDDWSTANTNCPELAGYDPSTRTNNYIRVWRNGAELTYDSGSTFDANEFKFTASSGTISLGSAATTGDVIKVTIKAGDVPEETISFTY